MNSLDLHVLGTPPAFVLSKDQTLQESWLALISYVGLASFLKPIIFVCLHDFVCLVFKEQFIIPNQERYSFLNRNILFLICRSKATSLIYHIQHHDGNKFFKIFFSLADSLDEDEI